jgi:hypothetical protein
LRVAVGEIEKVAVPPLLDLWLLELHVVSLGRLEKSQIQAPETKLEGVDPVHWDERAVLQVPGNTQQGERRLVVEEAASAAPGEEH